MSGITNDEELASAVAEANALLQAIQDYFGGRAPSEAARIRFPRGYIRTAEQGRKRLFFIRDYNLRTNISYSLMLVDVYTWILRRTDIVSTAREMVIKATLFMLGAIAESVLVGHYDGVMGRRQKFASRTRQLVLDGIVSESVKAELDWLWEMRNRQHLFLAERREIDHYRLTDFSRAAQAVTDLLDGLSAHVSEGQG